jgi:hypothetical protein
MKCYSFWAINAPLVDAMLADQLSTLRALGFHGAAFQPRFYTPPPAYLSEEWIAALRALCETFPDLDLYVQDENGWPAPSVDGRLTEGHPELRQSWVAAYPPGTTAPGTVIAADARATYVRQWGSYADTLNPEVTRRFIALTYDAHLPLQPWFGKPFKGFFCDEPQFGPLDTGDGSLQLPALGAVAWTDDLPAVYAARTGADLLTDLPALFHDLPESAAARIRYYELVADLFRERFIAPLVAWCRDHGIAWTGHYKGEEHPYFQLWFSGPLGDLYRVMGHAGVDSLERYPGERFFVRQAHGISRQLGTGGIVECCGGGGWGMTAQDVSRYLWWLVMHGFDKLVIHQAQYRLTPMAVHDWPPSTPFHQPYAGCLPELFAQLQQEMPAAPAVHPLLVVAPYRGLMSRLQPAERAAMDVHKASFYADSPAGNLNRRLLEHLHRLDAAMIGYDVVSEREFETLLGADLTLEQCRYATVLLTEGCAFTDAGSEKVAALNEAVLDCRSGGFPDLPALAARLHLPAHAAATPLPPEVAGDLFGDRIVLLNVSPEPAQARLTVPAITVDLLPGEARILPLDWTPSPEIAETVTWTPAVTLDNANALILDALTVEGDILHATLMISADIPAPALASLVVPSAISIDGENVPLVCDGSYHYPELGRYALPPLTAGEHTLSVTLAEPWVADIAPRLWLVGEFAVNAAWEDGPNGARRSDGPFSLAPLGALAPADLVAGGAPFYHGTATYHSMLTLPEGARTLRFTGVHAGALQVLLDGRSLSWAWGPHWEIPLPDNAGVGMHVLDVKLATTAFNLFGPHHHLLGDPAMCCTSHYTGERDFAQLYHPAGDVLTSATHVAALGIGGIEVMR